MKFRQWQQIYRETKDNLTPQFSKKSQVKQILSKSVQQKGKTRAFKDRWVEQQVSLLLSQSQYKNSKSLLIKIEQKRKKNQILKENKQMKD